MKNFIIVGTQRTGSSPFAEYLGLHPMITCGWEWTLGVAASRKVDVAAMALSGDFSSLSTADQNHMAEFHRSNKSWIGFRWLFSASPKWVVHPRFAPALWVDRLEAFIKWVRKRPDIHIIHIVRNNNLDWLKSIYLARKTDAYTSIRYPAGIKVKIPTWQAVNRLRAKRWVERRLDALQQTNPSLRIDYESFSTAPGDTVSRATRFLDCSPALPDTSQRKLHKQSTGNPADYIANYQALIDSLTRRGLLESAR